MKILENIFKGFILPTAAAALIMYLANSFLGDEGEMTMVLIWVAPIVVFVYSSFLFLRD